MLTDNGKVSRNMKYGRIEYQSNATLLLGTQTERLEWISGMSRRFLFLDLNPTLKDMTDYNEAWELGEGIGPDRSKLNKLREGWAMLSTLPPNLIHIELTKEYLDFRAKLPVPHTDKDILNRLAIGWNFMNNFKWEDKVLEVGAPPELQRLVFTAIEMKYRIMGETGFLTIEKVLGDGKWHSLTETTWDLVKLGIGNYSRASARLREMISLGLIEIRLDKTTDRPRKLLRLSRTVTERAMTEG